MRGAFHSVPSRPRHRGWRALCFAISAVALLSGACAFPEDDTGKPLPLTADGRIDYSELDGDVTVDGSSTVFPISEAAAEEFTKVARGVQTKVALSGTGGGFEKFCRGEIDVADASRRMNDREREACAAKGIAPGDIVEIQVAIDALTVVVNPHNDWAKCMTVDQLRKAFQDGGASRWSDLDPSWPEESIRFYYPGADSGTFDYFREALKMRGVEQNEPSHRSDGTSSEDDNVLVRGLEGDRYAIGYFGLAYFLGEGRGLKAVEIDNGKGCVAPSFETALDGSYKPLSRALYVYTGAHILQRKPHVLGFLDFYLKHTNELAKEVGYVSLPDDLLAAQQAKLQPFIAAGVINGN